MGVDGWKTMRFDDWCIDETRSVRIDHWWNRYTGTSYSCHDYSPEAQDARANLWAAVEATEATTTTEAKEATDSDSPKETPKHFNSPKELTEALEAALEASPKFGGPFTPEDMADSPSSSSFEKVEPKPAEDSTAVEPEEKSGSA